MGACYHRSRQAPIKRAVVSIRHVTEIGATFASLAPKIVPSEPRVSYQSALRLGVRFSELSAVRKACSVAINYEMYHCSLVISKVGDHIICLLLFDGETAFYLDR